MLSIEDWSKVTSYGLGLAMAAVGSAMVPLAYVGFLGLPVLVFGVVLVIYSALSIKEGHTEPAPSYGGMALIVIGAVLAGAAAWVMVQLAADGNDLTTGEAVRETLHVIIAPALLVVGMRLRFPWSIAGVVGLYAAALLTPMAAWLVWRVFALIFPMA